MHFFKSTRETEDHGLEMSMEVSVIGNDRRFDDEDQRDFNVSGLEQWFSTWDRDPVGVVCLFSGGCENFW